MALRITDTLITSDEVPDAWAEFSPSSGTWTVSFIANQTFDRNQAITAMTIAEEKSRPSPDALLISSLEQELR